MASRRTFLLSAASFPAVVTLTACGTGGASTSAATSPSASASDAAGPVTIYSGRNEKLIAPLLAQVEAATGVKVEVRYGESSALAAQLLEEGKKSPADVFFSQDAGALGALVEGGLLATLDPKTTGSVLKGFADPKGRWVATSARARVVAYHPTLAPEAANFTAIDQVLDPKYRGRIGYAPTNASFHAFVTALRVAKGEAGAKEWLTKFKANEPKAFDKNTAVLAAVDGGQVSLGLINHYYWYELAAEKGAGNVTAKIRFLGSDDPGALINVAGVGILKSTDQPQGAAKVVSFLVGPQGQQFFADKTAEYPVVAGVSTTRHQLPALSDLVRSSVDLNALSSLKATLALLTEVGLT